MALSSSGTSVTIVFNKLPELARTLPDLTWRITKEHALALTAAIKAEMVAKDIIDTGSYLNSWDLPAAVENESKGTWVVSSDIEYGPHQEYGTARGLPARPHVVPAAKKIEGLYQSAVEKAMESPAAAATSVGIPFPDVKDLR